MSNEELNKRIEELEKFVENMQASFSLPLDVDRALVGRSFVKGLKKSTKAADSEDITINESGSGVKTVLDNPNGYLEVSIDGVMYYIPYFAT